MKRPRSLQHKSILGESLMLNHMPGAGDVVGSKDRQTRMGETRMEEN